MIESSGEIASLSQTHFNNNEKEQQFKNLAVGILQWYLAVCPQSQSGSTYQQRPL